MPYAWYPFKNIERIASVVETHLSNLGDPPSE